MWWVIVCLPCSDISACFLSAAMPTACDMAFVPVTTVSLTLPSLLHFFQNSLIKRIKGENVYVKHSNLMLEVGIGTQPVHARVCCWSLCGIRVDLNHDAWPVCSAGSGWGWLLDLTLIPSSLLDIDPFPVYVFVLTLWLHINVTS